MLTVVDILGVRVQSGPVRDVVEHIDQRVTARDTTRVAFLNAHLSNVCAGQADVRERLDEFLVLNDGIGVDIARRVLHGGSFTDNLNGTDFVTAFLDGTAHDLRIFLLGARQDVIARTAELIEKRWPRHRIVGVRHGFFDATEESALGEIVKAAHADVVLVGMGNPRQERWIAANVPKVCPAAIAVGAWFDFVSGTVPRAPHWMRTARLEWVYRLCLEPRRLASRYLLGNLVFLTRLGLHKVRPRGSHA